MVEFDSILQRADDETLQMLVGNTATKLLNAINPQFIRPARLRKILLNLYDRADLLRDKKTRRELLSLLRPDEATELIESFTTNYKDPYDGLYKMGFRKNSAKEKALFDFFRIDAPNNDAGYSHPTETSLKPSYSLFKHQRKAAEKVKQYIFQGHKRRVLLHMPTGSGKTRTTMNIVSDFLRGYEPALIVWLAYSEELCEQAATEFESCWSYLGNRKLNVYRFWGGHSLDIDNVNEGLVVSSLSKMYNSTNQGLYFIGQLGSKANLVVFDEAHQSIAPTFKHVIKGLLVHSDKTGLIGLSATPGRTWNDINQDLELSEFFYKQKVTLKVEGYQNPVDFLVEEEYLAKADYKKIEVDADLDLSVGEAEEIQSQLDIPGSVLKKLAINEKRNLVILSKLKELSKRHTRILFFATNVEHSELIAKVLQATGIDAYSITSDTTKTNRKKWINKFKSDSEDSMILCNYGVLTTGFDAPRTSAALIARPTKSLVLYSQMVGRAIRGTKAGGNKSAEIMTVIDTTLPGFRNVADAFTNWEDVWNKENINNN